MSSFCGFSWDNNWALRLEEVIKISHDSTVCNIIASGAPNRHVDYVFNQNGGNKLPLSN
jgi:hypothetical protein